MPIEVHVVKHDFGQSYAQIRGGSKSEWMYMFNPVDFVRLGEVLNYMGFVSRPDLDYPGVLVFEYEGNVDLFSIMSVTRGMSFAEPPAGWIEADFEPSFVKALTN